MATKTGESDMKRIPPQDVVDSYIATGCYPITNTWTTCCGGACALGSLYLASGGDRVGAWSEPIFRSLSERFGVDEQYLMAFSSAFSFPENHGIRGDEGFLDGLAAQRAVTAHFAKAPAEQPQAEGNQRPPAPQAQAASCHCPRQPS